MSFVRFEIRKWRNRTYRQRILQFNDWIPTGIGPLDCANLNWTDMTDRRHVMSCHVMSLAPMHERTNKPSS